MLDMNAALAAAPPHTIRREDYRAPDWLVPDIAIEFDLDPARTLVRARLTVTRNDAHAGDGPGRPLRLDGEEADLHKEMAEHATDFARVAGLDSRLRELSARRDELETRWLELSEGA